MSDPTRREFIQTCAASTLAGVAPAEEVTVDAFDRADSVVHGDGWESLNPGYWKIEARALRRKLKNRGDRRSGHWFPWHWETHRKLPMPKEYDPSLPFGMMLRREWKLAGRYRIRIEAKIRALPERPKNAPDWKEYRPGYGLVGIVFGSEALHESWTGRGRPGRGDAAWMAAWRDDGRFGVYDHATDGPAPAWKNSEQKGFPLKAGDRFVIEVAVGEASLTAEIRAGGRALSFTSKVDRRNITDGYFGLVCRGLLDFEVNRVVLDPGENKPAETPLNELHVCYPLGDTLTQVDGKWTCRYMAFFRNGGDKAEVRVADSPDPAGGWKAVPVAGRGGIVTNSFRRNTAVIDVTLPANPAEKVLYYTVWKDGKDVTADPRIGTPSVGSGTGFIGQVPGSGRYVGRLPRLTAPYRLIGLSCHAISYSRPKLPRAGSYQEWWFHDQPTPEAYQHLEDYGLQIMMWEDDVWYLELVFAPPSTDDAYKIILSTLAGPTTRWQMMRHWNVLNPGDHDYGMDDVKGPEQMIIRKFEGLGQDPEYMRRNFQIVQHVITGNEDPSATANPKRWRRWKMPEGDFSLLILDSRLWRTSQDTKIWDDEGWGHLENLYDRRDPTRALLGEEQFAWLRQAILTDSSPLICLTGINGLHTIWQGTRNLSEKGAKFGQRDRVAADYAGWVAAGAERVLEVLGSRPGVVTTYGDVHVGCIMKNVKHGVTECSFGPIGRSGGRQPKPGFGPRMEDYDGRALEVTALYHANYRSPKLDPREGPYYWNFLEMNFDPRGEDPKIGLRIRNLVDGPKDAPRGGGHVETTALKTGRPFTCRLPEIKTLPDAHVRLATADGRPIRGARSLADGTVPVPGLADVKPGTRVVVTASRGDEADAKVVRTLPL